MTLIYQKEEFTWFLFPKDVPKVIAWLSEKGYEPKKLPYHGLSEVYEIKKDPRPIELLMEEWDKHTGYDKILERLIRQTTKKI